MAGTSTRRPVPAVIFILLLSLLTGLVWYRVLHRPDSVATGPSKTSAHCTPATATGLARSWPEPSTVTLSVLNASQRDNLAHSVAAEFKSRGFKIGSIGNDTTGGATATQVRYAPGSATAARLVQLYLPGARLVAVSGTSDTVVVAVGSSYTNLATAKQVKKQRAAPAPTC